ncbi:class I SAM-dependent methyltransferase [Actinomadura napierensis]|uniref:Class I SAM-dependent methyltransferase n=1 Tax=Actinomadura napierensis TaxID=267854 RepID=A0ABN2Z2H9_9ACTN
MRRSTGEHSLDPSGYDAELRRHNEVLRRICGVRLQDVVLDIGCGTGQTTREAARAAREGNALGVDVSAPAIERARESARAEGLRNVTFEVANAEVHRFPQERFDLAISRFGTMFFDDPAAAFANIGRALRPAGRLVMLVWQPHDRNEWAVEIRQSIAGFEGAASTGPDAFSLGDPATVRRILDAAGFTEITFTDVDESVYYGPDVDAALDWVRRFACTSEIVKRLDAADEARAVGRLRETLTAHLSDDGVWFGSRAWVVTARRGAPSR